MSSTAPAVAVSTLTEPLFSVPVISYDPGAVMVIAPPETVTLLPETVALEPLRVIVAVGAATAVAAKGPAISPAVSPAATAVLREVRFMEFRPYG
jgi:hypothetical protein